MRWDHSEWKVRHIRAGIIGNFPPFGGFESADPGSSHARSLGETASLCGSQSRKSSVGDIPTMVRGIESKISKPRVTRAMFGSDALAPIACANLY